MEVYTLTKIFGIDVVKTRVYSKKIGPGSAMEDINETVALFCDMKDVEVLEKESETYYIINKSKNPEDYIVLVLKRCEIK